MKYKFKPQTTLLVAGMLAATYAEACWYQNTSAVCYTSGSTVDTIFWGDGSGSQPVVATADWLAYPLAGGTGYLVHSGTGGTGYLSYTADPSVGTPTACSGPAQFRDRSNHLTSVTEWTSNSADQNSGTFWNFTGPEMHAGTVITSTTCQ